MKEQTKKSKNNPKNQRTIPKIKEQSQKSKNNPKRNEQKRIMSP
jgi:hypothetical protein